MSATYERFTSFCASWWMSEKSSWAVVAMMPWLLPSPNMVNDLPLRLRWRSGEVDEILVGIPMGIFWVDLLKIK